MTSADQPTLSKDGTRIVFRSLAGATNPVAIPFDPATERTGPSKQIVDRTGSLFPTGVSPDGQWLALTNQFERQEDVFIARIDGTGLRRLTDDAFRDRVPVWSPDGKEIAFSSNRTDTYGIWTIKPDGSGLRQVTERSGGNEQNLLYPTFSPTGDRLVASRLRANETIGVDPRREWKAQKPDVLQMTVSRDAWLIPTAWSPDGRRLVGTVVNTAGSTIAVGVDHVGTRTARSVIDGFSCFCFVWLSDSRRVAYVELDTRTIWLLDVENGRRKALVMLTEAGLRPGDLARPTHAF